MLKNPKMHVGKGLMPLPWPDEIAVFYTSALKNALV